MRLLVLASLLALPALAQRLPTHALDDPSPTFGGFFGSTSDASGERVAAAGFGTAVEDQNVVVYRRDPLGWTIEAVVTGSQIQIGVDVFGLRLALDGDRLAVTAGKSPDLVVYVFDFDGSTWVETAILSSPGAGSQHGSFGASLDLQGDTLAVGEPGAFIGGQVTGAVYVFREAGGTWTFEQELIATDGGPSHGLGSALALDSDVCLVGAQGIGRSYVFRRAGAVWTEEAILLPPIDAPGFADSVALDGDRALIGAPLTNGWNGAAFFYERVGGVWQHEATVLESTSQKTPRFGTRVALRGDVAAISAPFAKFGNVISGRIDLFTRAGGTWESAAVRTLRIEDGYSSAYLGDGALDIEAGTVVAGAPNALGTFAKEGKVFTFALDDPLGTNYCTANANSTGAPGAIGVRGSSWRSDETVTFEATDLPVGQFGYLLASESTAFVPLFGGSQGNLCLGTPQFRFAKHVLVVDGAGRVEQILDFHSLPAGMTVAPGSTWYYQLWFRDVNPGPTSNTTDGIQLLLE